MIDESVTVTTVVPAPPDEAFTIFTTEVDAWWRRTPRYRQGAAGSVVQFADDHLIEVTESGALELGRVLAWEPGRRLMLEWLDSRRPDWAGTSVEIRFEPVDVGTRVTLVHRGWTGIRPGDARSSVIALWWGDLLASCIYHVRRRPTAHPPSHQ